MRRTWVGLWLGAAVCACAAPESKPADSADTGAEPAPEPAADPSQPGPYAVGVHTLEVTDPRGKSLVVEVWYPASPEPGAEPATYPPTTLSASAVRDAVADLRGAPYPLLGFSHGFGGIRFQSVTLVEHLVTHGYVVVSPDHARNTFLDLDEDAVPEVVLERPDDVRYSIDAVAAAAQAGEAPLGGIVDSADEWAVLGHSFGAYTAMVLGGGTLDLDGLVRYCADPSARGRACRYVDAIDPSALPNHGQADPRVTLTVPYSPGLWYAFGEDGAGLATVSRPLVMVGDQDDVLEYDTEARPAYEAMSAPKKLATFHTLGHYPFSDICVLLGTVWDECDPTTGEWGDVEEAQVHANTLTAAYLEVELRGRTELSAWLDPTAWSDVEMVTLEQQ